MLQTRDNLLRLHEIVKTELTKGQIFKNFAELCRALKETPPKGGSSREARKSLFKRCFDFESIENSHKIIIKEVYEHVLPNFQVKGMRQATQHLFLSWCKINKLINFPFIITLDDLVNKLNFINQEYFKLKQKLQKKENYPDNDEYKMLKHFMSQSTHIIKYNCINSSIISMKNKLVLAHADAIFIANGQRLSAEMEGLWADIKIRTLKYMKKKYNMPKTPQENHFYDSENLLSKEFWGVATNKWKAEQTEFTQRPVRGWEFYITSLGILHGLSELSRSECELNLALVKSMKENMTMYGSYGLINCYVLRKDNIMYEAYPGLNELILEQDEELHRELQRRIDEREQRKDENVERYERITEFYGDDIENLYLEIDEE